MPHKQTFPNRSVVFLLHLTVAGSVDFHRLLNSPALRHLGRPKVLYFATSVKTKVDILCAECAQLHDIVVKLRDVC